MAGRWRWNLPATLRIAVPEVEMSRYFFDVKNGHRLIDPAGLDCRDDQDAITQATVIARQIALDVPETSGARHVAVLGDERKEVTSTDSHQQQGREPWRSISRLAITRARAR
jgi:hypothetical protein